MESYILLTVVETANKVIHLLQLSARLSVWAKPISSRQANCQN